MVTYYGHRAPNKRQPPQANQTYEWSSLPPSSSPSSSSASLVLSRTFVERRLLFIKSSWEQLHIYPLVLSRPFSLSLSHSTSIFFFACFLRMSISSFSKLFITRKTYEAHITWQTYDTHTATYNGTTTTSATKFLFASTRTWTFLRFVSLMHLNILQSSIFRFTFACVRMCVMRMAYGVSVGQSIRKRKIRSLSFISFLCCRCADEIVSTPFLRVGSCAALNVSREWVEHTCTRNRLYGKYFPLAK